jgi:hypothetical protein
MRQFVREAFFHQQLREIMRARPFQAHASRPNLGSVISLAAFRRLALPLAACLALATGLGLWLFSAASGQPFLAEAPPSGLIILRGGQPIAPSTRLPLLAGDTLRTSADATAVIAFAPENTRLTLRPGSDLSLADMSHGKQFILHSGALDAEARVVGTRFTLAVNTNNTRLDVFEGRVKFTRLTDHATSLVGAGHYALAGDDTEISSLPFTGSITRQWWTNVAAQNLDDAANDPRFPDHPTGADAAKSFELASLATNRFFMRYCGYLQPAISGNYAFWLSGATGARLFVSPDENPAHKVVLANTLGAGRGAFDTPRFQGSSQWSPPSPLVAGHRYYIEVVILIKQGEGQFSVAWQRDAAPREPIPMDCLSPLNAK